MADTTPLIDVDYLRDRHPDRTFNDTQVELLIDETSSAIRNYCGWHLAPSVTEDVTIDGSGSSVLLLPTTHLTGVDEVTEDGVVVDPDNVDWSQVGYLTRDAAWTVKPRGVVASIVHGYAEVPAELKAVCASAVLRALTSPAGVSRSTAGPYSDEYLPGGFLPEETTVLDRYRLPPRP